MNRRSRLMEVSTLGFKDSGPAPHLYSLLEVWGAGRGVSTKSKMSGFGRP